MRDEKAVCSTCGCQRDSNPRGPHAVRPVGAGFVDLGLGLGVWFCVLRIFVFKTVSGVMHYLMLSVRKPTPNPFCGDVPI
jgi:hypothetical protein